MKRLLVRFGVFIVLGTAVNIAVAWGFAAMTNLTPAKTDGTWYRRGDEMILIESSSAHGLAALWIGLGNHKLAPSGERHNVAEFPRIWAYLASPTTRGLEPGYAVVARSAVVAGWPMYAMWCEEFCMLGGGSRSMMYSSRTGGVASSLHGNQARCMLLCFRCFPSGTGLRSTRSSMRRCCG